MVNIDLSKYTNSLVSGLNEENIMKIISFLHKNKCDYIDELLEDYLDIFTFKYEDFVLKFNKLNKKYNNNLINEIKEDMNILEEFYY